MPVLVQRHGRTRYVGSQASYIIWGEDKGTIISRIADTVEFCLEIAKVVTFAMANPSTVNFEFEIAKVLSQSLEVSKTSNLQLAIEKVKTFTLELAKDVKKMFDL